MHAARTWDSLELELKQSWVTSTDARILVLPAITAALLFLFWFCWVTSWGDILKTQFTSDRTPVDQQIFQWVDEWFGMARRSMGEGCRGFFLLSSLGQNSWQKPLKEVRLCLGSQFKKGCSRCDARLGGRSLRWPEAERGKCWLLSFSPAQDPSHRVGWKSGVDLPFSPKAHPPVETPGYVSPGPLYILSSWQSSWD